MKIRNGFVTNSSSSSFVLATVKTKDGKRYNFENETVFCSDVLPIVKDGKLYLTTYDEDWNETLIKIKSVKELAAALYLCGSEFYSDVSVKAGIATFLFFLNKMSAKALINKLKGFDGFEELEDIDPDDYDDKNELKEEIMNIVSCVLSDEYDIYQFEDWEYMLENDDIEIQEYKNFIKNVKELTDIESLMFNITEHNFGEFAGLYSERADGLREKYNLVAISENDENYENEFDKWCEIVKTEILDTNSDPMPTVFEMVEKALKTGDYLELAPHSVSNTDEYEIDLSSLK